MFVIRFGLLMLIVVAAAVVAVLANVWWLSAFSVLVPVAMTVAAVLLTLHYTGSPEWLGGEEEAQLERADLVERETGARWRVIGACAASASVTPRSDALAAPIHATRDRSRRVATAAGPASRCLLGARTPAKSDETGDGRWCVGGAGVRDMQG
jgi:hypothetical protein